MSAMARPRPCRAMNEGVGAMSMDPMLVDERMDSPGKLLPPSEGLQARCHYSTRVCTVP